MKWGGLEAGGTKMVMAVADENLNIQARVSLPTRTPPETMPGILDFFQKHPVDALGVASFGPVDLHPQSPSYGSILKTPKLDWVDYPILSTLRNGLGIPCGFDTDVNAAALCEAEMGAGKGASVCVYVTVGTGIGGGAFCDGQLLHGLMHPEMGHILLSPRADDPSPRGFCPYHPSCLEGLASGPAIEKRWGKPARELPFDHPAWDLEAHYLAQMCVTLLMTLSPEKIILGGGVMGQKQLLPMIQRETVRLLGGYLACIRDISQIIVTPDRYPDSGLLGALLLAKKAADARA